LLLPIGTVDLLTTTVKAPPMCRPTLPAAELRYCRSGLPSGSDGVWTAMKITSASGTASAYSQVKVIRSAASASRASMCGS
jgi:hypothetical protein